MNYIDDFDLELRYLSRSDLSKIFDESKEFIWDKRDHTRREQINYDKFYTKLAGKTIVNWRGLTASTLKKLLPLDEEKISDPNIEIPYTPENAVELLRGAYDFDLFIQKVVVDIEKFNEEKLEAEKKI